MDDTTNPVIEKSPEIIRALEEDDVGPTDVAREYLEAIDSRLIDLGWGFRGAKTVEFGYKDQSLLNHVRNGVFFLLRLNAVAEEVGARSLSGEELRDVLAMYVAHDLHKTRDSSGPEEEFDIPREDVETFIEETGILDFGSSVNVDDLWSCACAHHYSWNAKTGRETLPFKELKYYVRLADAFASSPTPEQAVEPRNVEAFDDVFGGGLDLGHHTLSETTGILTNLLNAAVADFLEEYGYRVLCIYQDGCVYATEDRGLPDIDADFVEDVYETFTEKVRSSHHSYTNPAELASNIDTIPHLGYYKPSAEDFFYAGPDRVIEGLVYKAIRDGENEDDLPDNTIDTIEQLEQLLDVEINKTRQVLGVARMVGAVGKHVVPRLDVDDEVIATAEVFGSSDAFVRKLSQLDELDEDIHGELTSGGKWDYSYAIAQQLLHTEFDEVKAKDLSPANFGEEISRFLLSGLSKLKGWGEIADAFVDDVRDELTAYIADILVIQGESADMDSGLTDTFDEYTSKQGRKICALTNRGTTSSSMERMKAHKSLTTLKAGFTNRKPIGSAKDDDLIISYPMQIEFSLRKTGSQRREGNRLFFHFVPDYFFTPLSWRLTRTLINRYKGENRVRMGRLAEAIFASGYGSQEYSEVLENLAYGGDGGRGMVESLMQDFEEGFGGFEFAYFKSKENDTEFEFFGVYLALAIAGFTGLRVYVSRNPVPNLRARDFDEMARIGLGLSQVSNFYGESVSLTELENTLRHASALIRLGYAHSKTKDKNNNPRDSFFPKYLRVTRNKPLPGSYLLKRLAQSSDDEAKNARYLLDEARYLDVTTGVVAE